MKKWDNGSRPSAASPVTVHFCPSGQRCAFVLTDHGDRTRTPISSAVYMGHSDPSHSEYGSTGLVGSGIKVTQGVFCSGWEGCDYLDNPKFLDLMRQISASGSEICPHNTSEHMGLPPDETRTNMELYAREFGLRTWIDHFRLPTNLSQKGMDRNSPYFILDHFKQLGGRVAWSYQDRMVNPCDGQLSLLKPTRTIRYVIDLFRQLFRVLIPSSSSQARIIARSRLGHIMARFLGPDFLSGLVDLVRKVSLVKSPGLWLGKFFGLIFSIPSRLLKPSFSKGFPVRYDEASGLYWFDSCRVTFVTNCYNKTNLDALVASCGIHIGHTYLGFETSRHFDFAFRRDGDDYAIDVAFQEFITYLASQRDEGLIWNPTMSELVSFIDQLAATEVTQTEGGGGSIRNVASEELPAITLRSLSALEFDGVVPVRELLIDEEHWYVLNIPAGSSVAFEPTKITDNRGPHVV